MDCLLGTEEAKKLLIQKALKHTSYFSIINSFEDLEIFFSDNISSRNNFEIYVINSILLSDNVRELYMEICRAAITYIKCFNISDYDYDTFFYRELIDVEDLIISLYYYGDIGVSISKILPFMQLCNKSVSTVEHSKTLSIGMDIIYFVSLLKEFDSDSLARLKDNIPSLIVFRVRSIIDRLLVNKVFTNHYTKILEDSYLHSLNIDILSDILWVTNSSKHLELLSLDQSFHVSDNIRNIMYSSVQLN